jgi:phosphotransferase system HPr (HPr) family protein
VTRGEAVISNTLGLHARAAARFVQAASRFKSRIQLSNGGRTADGKSILGLLALIGRQGTRLTICADGPDEQEALGHLVALVEARFGEDR